jgi:hypothetical protein
MLCSIATRVDESKLQVINDLEKDLGKTILAFQCHQVSPSRLSTEELRKIQEVETRLGISLIAVDA